MAKTDNTTSRRRVLGALATLPAVIATPSLAQLSPVDRTAWDRRLAEYQRRQLLAEANCDFGALRAACDEWERFKDRHPHVPENKAAREAAWSKLSRAEDVSFADHTMPTWAAARALVETPAPDFAAVRVKLDIIKEHELDNDAEMLRSPFAIISEDVARLARLA